MRARVALFVLPAVLAAAVPARAAELAEVPFRPLPGVGTCLRATGEPGGLALLGPLGRRTSATDLLRASSAGTVRVGRTALGNLVDCAAVRTDPSGAAVVAGAVRSVRRGRARIAVWAAVRDPGGAFGAPVRLGRASERSRRVVAAVSPRADAVVAWAQARGSAASEDERVRIVAVRRTPGAPFGAVEPLTPWRPADSAALDAGVLRLVAGADDAGGLTVAWKREPQRLSPVHRDAPVEVAAAGPGARFGEPQRVGAAEWFDPAPPALAVAAGGRTLLAFTAHGGGIQVLERAPRSADFAPVVRFEGGVYVAPAVALRDDGAAVVAWRTSPELEAGVAAALRLAGGGFAPALPVAPDLPRTQGFPTDYAQRDPDDRPRPPWDHTNAALRAALAPDGHALLGWTVPRAAAAAVTTTPMAATGTLATAFGEPVALGSPARAVNGVAPLVLLDGTPALAWTDNVPETGFLGAVPEFAAGGGRLHLAVPGPAAGGPAPPRLSVRARRSTPRITRFAVRCTAACDVRASVPTGAGVVGKGTAASLPRAGRRLLRLRAPSGEPWRVPSVRVHVLATAPGGARARLVVRRVRLR